MTKKNLIIVIILLSIIDLVAAGWYMSRRIEASGMSQSLFDQRDSTDVIVEADTVTEASQADVFDKLQHHTYYFIANKPSIQGDNSSRYTSVKHVKVKWPKKINGDDELNELNKELISKAFGNSQVQLKEARYTYLNTPSFNKPIGDDYTKLSQTPKIVPVYGNVSQVLVYPYMTSQRLLVMEIDKVEYDGSSTVENNYYIHYDRAKQKVLSRLDILTADVDKESKLLKLINKKIDDLNRGRGDYNRLQHALNVPSEICCGKKGILFQYKQGTLSSSSTEIMIDYDKLDIFFTAEFKQLVDNNEGYHVYNESIKPEAINPVTAAPKKASTPAVKSTTVKKKKNYYYKKPYSSKRGYRSRRKYNGGGRKSGYHGYSGKRHSSRRRH